MAVCDVLASIAKNCKINIKGITPVIRIAEAGNVTIPARDADSHTVSTDVTMETGSQFYEWAVADDDQIQFTSSSVGNIGDLSYENVLTAFIPGSDDAKDMAMNEVLNGDYVVSFGQKDQQSKLMGNSFSPAHIQTIVYTNNGTQNGWLVTIMQRGESPLFYTGAIPLTPAA